jgi:hypothetical protein
MCPLQSISDEDKKDQVEKANKRVYIHYKTKSRCLYASNIIKAKDAVNCDFGDTGAGMSVPTFNGSPLYAQTFSGIGLDGLYAFPLGFYADNNESRNLFQGLFSVVGKNVYDEIIKETAMENGVSRAIVEKLKSKEQLTNDERLYLAVLRKKYEDARTDSAKARELAEKWNPRKRL